MLKCTGHHSLQYNTYVTLEWHAGAALAGILAVLHSCLDLKATIGGSQYHHILYYLTTAMKPRMLMTVDKDMNLLPVSVRVGQAVDVVAQVCTLSVCSCNLRMVCLVAWHALSAHQAFHLYVQHALRCALSPDVIV